MNRDELQNTLANAFDNLNAGELSQITCDPLDSLYMEKGVSVVALHQNGKLLVSVGFEGSAESVYNGNDPDAAALATVKEIVLCLESIL